MKEPISLGPLHVGEWRSMVEALAADANSAGDNADLQTRLDLSMRAVSLLWMGLTPSTIARSARASAALNEPVIIASTADLDQQVVCNRKARCEALQHLENLPRPGVELRPLVIDEDSDVAPETEPEQPLLKRGWGGELVPTTDESETVGTADVAQWWGMCQSWVGSLVRRGVLQPGVHYRRRKPGEPRGHRFYANATHKAISDATGRPIPAAPLQTLEENRRPRMRRTLAEKVLAELQAEPVDR